MVILFPFFSLLLNFFNNTKLNDKIEIGKKLIVYMKKIINGMREISKQSRNKLNINGLSFSGISCW